MYSKRMFKRVKGYIIGWEIYFVMYMKDIDLYL